VALLGENGAGKSTLLAAMAGDRTLARGRVTLAGRPLKQWSAIELARRRAVLPQRTTVAFGFTALEVVLMGRYPHSHGAHVRTDIEIAYRALACLDADRFAGRSVQTLSGGEAARVHLARVVAQLWDVDGAVLLLDEPTASLDPAQQRRTLGAISALARDRALAVLIVLHDVNLAARYADRIALMRQGRILVQGPPADVLIAEQIQVCYGIEAQVLAHPGDGGPLVVFGHSARGKPADQAFHAGARRSEALAD
jgi:iron complex transport system ATP-binding protein